MKTKQEHSSRGSGLVYVLIAVALFAALTFSLMRQMDSSESNALSSDQAELLATQLINYAAQAKSSVDQMLFSGSTIDKLEFHLPGETDFSAGTQAERVHFVYHPEGGGLNPGVLNDKAKVTGSNPDSGWYMGAFNNVEWTESTATDVILTAYRINKTLCEKINLKVTGNTTIPTVNAPLMNLLVDEKFHNGTNADFNISNCAACEGYDSLCVSNAGGTEFAFYNVISAR